MPNRNATIIQDWMTGPDPAARLKQLHAEGWLKANIPELVVLYGIPQPAAHHPEIDTGVHTELVLQQAAILSGDPRARFAALVHDLGKGVTNPALWPRHFGHEELGVKPVFAVCERFALPADWRHLAVMTSRYHLHAHKAFELKASSIVNLIRHGGFLEQPDLFALFVVACEADARGRLGLENRRYPQADFLLAAFEAVRAVEAEDLYLHPERVSAVKRVRRQFKDREGESYAT